jgi:hypothetical protein
MNGVFTSESATEGHPDKVADQVSDAILDACLEQDSRARVASESLVAPGNVVLAGEITTTAQAIERQHTSRAAVGLRYVRTGQVRRAQHNCAHIELDPVTAGELSVAWHALSRATHHHPYELDPTAEELRGLLASSGRTLDALRTRPRKSEAML